MERQGEGPHAMVIRLARILAVAALLALAGCASQVHGILIPVVGGAEGGSRVDMLVATTRGLDVEDPSEMFAGDRAPAGALSFAAMAISIPPDQNRVVGQIQWPRSVPGNPARDFVTLRADIINKAEAVKEFHQGIVHAPGRQVLVFVHGYNTRYKDAVFRFAQIVHDSGTMALPVLFTWPSRGKLLGYGYDHDSTDYSRDGLEAVLRALVKDGSVKDVTILAHSMGNWLTLETLRQMAIRDGHVPAKISNVLLAAPDVDVDVFRTQFAAIGPHGPKLTLFVSQDDEALAVSQRIGLNARLGAINPQAEPFHSELMADRITVVDLTKVASRDIAHHEKFAQDPGVVELIGRRLAAGQTINEDASSTSDKIAGFTTRVVSGAGSVAGLAVQAPVAIFDPDTRDEVGDRFDRIKNNDFGTDR